ncbi:MAG: bifunctional folylpolyglutamate synthase/dihydrofolate synthase, partial [Clostridiales bacterium]|nr:bifunctional folylpolyglutamate synthase/dihydrofolate synthase [Clostridiales bacterium]
MTYDAALAYIARSYRQERHSLDHVRGVLRLLGDPQNQYKIIHIAGTNGKGSTCAMLHSILRESGLRTGLYTSPHLIKFNERIAVCGQIISDEDFAALTSRIQQASKRFFQNDFETLSFFEILTAMAFLYFYIQRVDAAVIEVGLGGRLDATNVIESPLLSVITAIGYDHTEVLGRTLAKIANEKGGIIKKNTPVILYLTTEQVYNTIKEICMARNADLY